MGSWNSIAIEKSSWLRCVFIVWSPGSAPMLRSVPYSSASAVTLGTWTTCDSRVPCCPMAPSAQLLPPSAHIVIAGVGHDSSSATRKTSTVCVPSLSRRHELQVVHPWSECVPLADVFTHTNGSTRRPAFLHGVAQRPGSIYHSTIDTNSMATLIHALLFTRDQQE